MVVCPGPTAAYVVVLFITYIFGLFLGVYIGKGYPRG